jgi:hypothetical protein
MKNYDILFMHNHFVLVTTIIMDEESNNKSVELAALKRLADEYGDDFAEIVKSSKKVTIEEVPGTSADEFNIPEPGDPEDAGMEK